MSTDWEKAAEETKFEDKPKLEAGFSGPVTIVKTLRSGSSGAEFEDRDNNAQLLVVFADDEGGENVQYYGLSGKRKWLFAKLVIASGMDIKRMKEDEVEFSHFEDNEFASANLCNRRLNLELVQNGQWVNAEVSPIGEEPLEELEEDDGPIDADACPF
jgi:hypothetical protein